MNSLPLIIDGVFGQFLGRGRIENPSHRDLFGISSIHFNWFASKWTNKKRTIGNAIPNDTLIVSIRLFTSVLERSMCVHGIQCDFKQVLFNCQRSSNDKDERSKERPKWTSRTRRSKLKNIKSNWDKLIFIEISLELVGEKV